MAQPAVIVEWYGPYNTVDDVLQASEEFDRSRNRFLLCLALGGDTSGGDAPRYRYIISWERTRRGAEEFPVDERLSDTDNQSFYLGDIASDSASKTGRTAEWALIRALDPVLNEPPNPCPPGWDNQYCGSVCSWFYDTTDEENRCTPPFGFPTVITFTSYNDPPDGDEERVLRLNLDGCDDPAST